MKKENLKSPVTTILVEPDDMPKQAIMDMLGFGPLSGQMEDIDDLSEFNIPEDTLRFLENEANNLTTRKIKFDKSCRGPKYIMFSNSGNVRKFWFGQEVLDEERAKVSDNFDDPNMGKDGVYAGYGINLIHRASGIFPEGLLLWIPDFEVFAVYNMEEFELKIFPDAKWSDIEENPGLYICSNFGLPEEVIRVESVYSHFNPWEKWEFIEREE